MTFKDLPCLVGERDFSPGRSFLLNDCAGQGQQVWPHPKRRQHYRQTVKTIEQIFAEAACLYAIQQPVLGRANDRNINARRSTRARTHRASFQSAQQSRLQTQRHFSNLVKEQRAAACPNPPDGSAPDVLVFILQGAKQFRLSPIPGPFRTADSDELAVTARTAVVDRPREPFLARAGFPFDQNRNVPSQRASRLVDSN